VHVRGVRVIHIAAAVALVSLTGCGGPSGPVRPSGPSLGTGSGTIEWLASSITQATIDPRQPLIDAFERAYPSIKVDLVTAPPSTDTERKTMISELSGGSATPDVYLGDVVWPYEFGHTGIALPLDHYLPASFWKRFRSASPSQPADSLVQAASYHGDTYAVPFFVDEGFLYYREDLLKQAGLPPPTTWEQLTAESNVLKSKGLAYQFVWQGDNYEGLTCDWTEFLADASGGPRAGAVPAAGLDSPQALRALSFLRSLITDGISPPKTTTFEEHEANDAFDSGHAAFLRGWDASYTTAMSPGSVVADPSKVGVEPPPTFQGQQGPGWSVIGGWDLYINPHTRNLRADLTFITWMTGAAAQRILATQYGEIPANAAVAQDPAVRRSNPVLRAAARTRLVSRPSSTIDYQKITEAIHAGIHSALPSQSSPGTDPCLALTGAARLIDPRVHDALPCASPAANRG
jgi:multiple sugar transport system substrate-binding protein